MKKYRQDKATALRSRAVTATLLIGGAFATLAMPVAAQPSNPAADGVPAARVQVFTTSDALRQATLNAVAANKDAQAKPPAASAGATVQATTPDVSIPWILDAKTRPWVLTAQDLTPLNVLTLSLPTEREARTMLPGLVADMTDQAKFIVSRYITDNIGAALQSRGRQLETLTQWLAALATQKQALPKDPWAAYQFNLEAREKAMAFKAKVSTQTADTVQSMAADINRAVAQVTPVMNVMGSYEQQLQWYNILVQLKDGMRAYQARAIEADSQILAALEAFERDNPPMARPSGPVPTEPGSVSVTQPVAVPTLSTATPINREAAKAPAAQEPQSGVSGNMVLVAVGGLVAGFFFMLRKRVASKGRSAKQGSE